MYSLRWLVFGEKTGRFVFIWCFFEDADMAQMADIVAAENRQTLQCREREQPHARAGGACAGFGQFLLRRVGAWQKLPFAQGIVGREKQIATYRLFRCRLRSF